jgi:hypothetical protein
MMRSEFERTFGIVKSRRVGFVDMKWLLSREKQSETGNGEDEINRRSAVSPYPSAQTPGSHEHPGSLTRILVCAQPSSTLPIRYRDHGTDRRVMRSRRLRCALLPRCASTTSEVS